MKITEIKTYLMHAGGFSKNWSSAQLALRQDLHR